MRGAVYNAAIPNIIANSVDRVLRPARRLRVAMKICCVLLGCGLLVLAPAASAADWSGPEQQLARKIVAVTGQGPAAVTVENRSSLSRRDSEVIQNGLRSALEGLGVHIANSTAANSQSNISQSDVSKSITSVKISLSENSTSYVWVAEIHRGAVESVMVMVSAPRPESTTAGFETVPLSVRKTLLFAQDDPILDVAVLEENGTPTRIAVLDAEKVALYRWQGGRWHIEQGLSIVHSKPWPRDLRGRLVPAKDHLLDAYLPGQLCRSGAGGGLTLSCRESDDPWPLVPAGLSGESASVFPSAALTAATIPGVGAFYAASRNFFTGALTAGIGTFSVVPKFYSAAFVPRDKSVLWLFAATDGRVHLIDGTTDQTAGLDWGSDVTSVKTACGAGWQVLATSSDEAGEDSVRAYEFPDRDPVAVSAAVDFGGVVTALWTDAKGDTATVVVRNQETGSYEAFRLAVACSQ